MSFRKNRFALLAVLCLGAAPTAHAQINWGLLQPQPDIFGNAMRAAEAGRAARAERDAAAAAEAERLARFEAAQRAQQDAEQERAERLARGREAGRLIAAGRCDDARNVALRDGDFALAEQVRSACRPPPLVPIQVDQGAQ